MLHVTVITVRFRGPGLCVYVKEKEKNCFTTMLDDATLSISRVLRTLHKERRADRIAHLRSIDHDANFVAGAHAALGKPALLANLRCGVWYVDQALSAGNCYFKSTDGHAGGWAFSLSRINMQVDRQLLAHPPPRCHLATSPPPPRLAAPSTTVPAASDRSRPRHDSTSPCSVLCHITAPPRHATLRHRRTSPRRSLLPPLRTAARWSSTRRGAGSGSPTA